MVPIDTGSIPLLLQRQKLTDKPPTSGCGNASLLPFLSRMPLLLLHHSVDKAFSFGSDRRTKQPRTLLTCAPAPQRPQPQHAPWRGNTILDLGQHRSPSGPSPLTSRRYIERLLCCSGPLVGSRVRGLEFGAYAPVCWFVSSAPSQYLS